MPCPYDSPANSAVDGVRWYRFNGNTNSETNGCQVR
jgi:hypothetical protein